MGCGTITDVKKKHISVVLSRDVLAQIDRLAGRKGSRSALIERVLREFLCEQKRARMRAQRHARDVKLINRAADRLNAEALDALEYQAPI